MPDPVIDTDIDHDAPPGGPFARAYAATVDDVDADRRWVISRINTDAVDRFNTVVDPAGMDRSEYEKNKVVLWEHGKDVARGRVPIGRAAWLKTEQGGRVIKAKTVFADDEFSRGLFELYRDEVLKGWSVYGTPTKASAPTREEVARRSELAGCKTIYRSWKLLEYSAVAIPGNLDAVTEAVSRGLWVPESVLARCPARAAQRPAPLPAIEPPAVALPPLVGRSLAEVLASVERSAREAAGPMLREALRDARDFARGKV